MNVPVCICIAALVKFFDEQGRRGEPKSITKELIRHQFQFIAKYCPQVRYFVYIIYLVSASSRDDE